MRALPAYRTLYVYAIVIVVALLFVNFAYCNDAYAEDSGNNSPLTAATPGVESGALEQGVPYTGSGMFFIISPIDRMSFIGLYKNDRTNDGNVAVCKRKNTNLLRFNLIPTGDGFYYVQNVATKRVLTAKSQGSGKANAIMSTSKKKAYQQWKLTQYPDGKVSFESRAYGLMLQMNGDGSIGRNVTLRAASAKAIQRFELKKATENKDETVLLEVPCYSQYPQLPTGCESVALTNALRYWGFKLGKTTIAKRWLPYGRNGVYNFIGNPRTSSGWIICAPGIANTAKRFLKSKKSNLRVKVYHGNNLKTLRKFLDKGYPVIVWGTDRMRNPGPIRARRSGYVLRGNTHTMVLAGYDPKRKKYLVADSISGKKWRNEKRFEYLYNKMGKQAVLIDD